MSMFDRNEPRMTGQPGRASCAREMPASASAICWASVAGIETGDIAPMSRNGVMTTGWLARWYSRRRLDHAVVPAQRRVAVDQRDDDRRLLDGLAAAEGDVAHRERVAGALGRDHAAHERLVGQRQQPEDHVEVARVERRVVGLDDGAAGGVELVEATATSWQKRSKSRSVASRRTRALAHERRAVDAGEVHVVAAEVDAARGVARLHVERLRRLGHLLEHEVGVEEDGVVLHALARAAEQLEGLGVHELDAELRDDPAPAPCRARRSRPPRGSRTGACGSRTSRCLLPRTLP